MTGVSRRGEVVVVSLDPTVGTEIRRRRPCVVVSNDVANNASPQVTVVPVTDYHARKGRFQVSVEVANGEGGLHRRSIILCSQIRTVDRSRLDPRPLGLLSSEAMRRVDAALKVHLALS